MLFPGEPCRQLIAVVVILIIIIIVIIIVNVIIMTAGGHDDYRPSYDNIGYHDNHHDDYNADYDNCHDDYNVDYDNYYYQGRGEQRGRRDGIRPADG